MREPATAHPNRSNTFKARGPKDQTVVEARKFRVPDGVPMATDRRSPRVVANTDSLRRPTEGFYDTALNEASDA